eukprot:gb/GFBE01059750.1/.p1 GENE.gb/GFBE01059750.1/~~gb/GFBE01059750.1/.p1  ORF type:complete len:150 (+),score=19.56 gb/GFBE01059750.1/:1-450(+)
MPGATAYEEGVFKEIKWRNIWATQYQEDKKAGRLKPPSRWVRGKYGRPTLLPPLEEPTPEADEPSRPGTEASVRTRSTAAQDTTSQRPSTSACSLRSGKRQLQRSKSEANWAGMTTSHFQSEMKRNFSLEASVLGSKFTPAHQPSRRMN